MATYTTRKNPDKKTWSVVSKDKDGKECIAYGKHATFERAVKHCINCNAHFGDK